ncbi:hypothetical protein G6F59_013820 [Rhizopus arrhizus]|nr:hypothetical protein G6F59_013820 [Rhizopus arrhizus]
MPAAAQGDVLVAGSQGNAGTRPGIALDQAASGGHAARVLEAELAACADINVARSGHVHGAAHHIAPGLHHGDVGGSGVHRADAGHQDVAAGAHLHRGGKIAPVEQAARAHGVIQRPLPTGPQADDVTLHCIESIRRVCAFAQFPRQRRIRAEREQRQRGARIACHAIHRSVADHRSAHLGGEGRCERRRQAHIGAGAADVGTAHRHQDRVHRQHFQRTARRGRGQQHIARITARGRSFRKADAAAGGQHPQLRGIQPVAKIGTATLLHCLGEQFAGLGGGHHGSPLLAGRELLEAAVRPSPSASAL